MPLRLRLLWVIVAMFSLGAQAQTPKAPSPALPAVQRLQKQAEAARQENRLDDAIALYQKGVKLQPNWEDGWWALGLLNFDQEHYPAARDSFRRLAALQPETGAPWSMLGLAEFETKQYDQALAHLQRGHAIHKGQEQSIADAANYHLALLLTRSQDYESAMKILALFAQRNLNDAKYIEAMGIASLRKPLLPAETAPTDRQLIMDVGRVIYDASALRTIEADAEFKILVDKYPDTPNIHYLYGSFLLFSDANAGLAEMKRELEISPAHVPALVTIAAEYIKRSDFKAALPVAERAVELEPQSFPAHTVLGRALAEGGIDVPRGVQELEVARKLAPTSPQVRIALATAYTKANRKDDAARERREFMRLRQEVDEKEASAPR